MLSPSLTRNILGAGLSLVLLAACDRQSGAGTQPQALAQATPTPEVSALDRGHKGEAMPAIKLTDPAGNPLAFAAPAGKPLLVNLWATWCGPCVTELPALDKVAASGTIGVLAISEDMTAPGKVAAFLAARHVGHVTAALDPEGNASEVWQAGTLPTSIYYDARGHELWRSTGGRDWGSAESKKLLAEGSAH